MKAKVVEACVPRHHDLLVSPFCYFAGWATEALASSCARLRFASACLSWVRRFVTCSSNSFRLLAEFFGLLLRLKTQSLSGAPGLDSLA